MARGRTGRVKKKWARKAFRALRRARLPRRVAKAGANRVGQVAGRTRRGRRRRSRRRKRY